jgi:hypothetical protein
VDVVGHLQPHGIWIHTTLVSVVGM